MKLFSRNFVENYIAWLVPFTPFLVMYGIGIMTITFFDVAILLGFIIIFAHGYKRQEHFINPVLVSASVLLFLNVVLIAPLNGIGDYSGILLRTLRFIYYILFCYIVISSGYFNFKKCYKVFKVMVIFASLYLLAQFVLLYVFNYSLKGYIPFLPLMREELSSFSETLSASSYARPRSIFDEPSQFGIYSSTFIVFDLLFVRKKRKYYLLFILLSMALSASSTAIMGFIIYFALVLLRMMNKRPILVVSLVIAALIFLILINVLSGVFLFDRLNLLVARLPTSFNNRIGGFIEYAERARSWDIFRVLFGIGMDMEKMTVWYSGIAKLPLYYGYIGSIYFVLVLLYVYMNVHSKQRTLITFFIIISLFSEVLLSSWLVLLLPLIIGDQSIFVKPQEIKENESITNQPYLQCR